MDKGNIYKVPCKGLADACRIMAGFVRDLGLFRPECVLISGKGGAKMADARVSRDGAELLAFVKSQGKTAAIVCTASTDSRDINRVVLAYMTGLDMLTLSFPLSRGPLSAKEKWLVERINRSLLF